MTMPSISSTQSVSGLYPVRHSHYKKELGPATPAATTTSPATAAEPLASAIAAALTQLGLTPRANAAGSDNDATANSPSSAALPLQQKTSPQIQQYKSVAATSSSLAQALSASSSSAPSTASGTGSLTSVFQSLWTSLGSSSGAATDASSSTVPSLQSFLTGLAHNFSESGITGLRGVFVDTVV
jgi:hypothetical protein